MIGDDIHALATRLWPINRSLTGDGVRETLRILREICPQLELFEIPTGTQVFDWTIPREWSARDAFIITPTGEKITDFKVNNLHLAGYSVPVNTTLSLEELEPHLYSLPDQPEAIPYVTSYYSERWGFCLPHSQRVNLPRGLYQVVIDSTLEAGSLTYGELIIPGETTQEVFLSTYVCHPSMANNELSGPTVTIHLAKWLQELPRRKFTYRLVFIPETIGSVAYLSRNIDHLKKYVIAGFNVTCVGDDRAHSYLPSRHGGTLADEMAKHVLKWTDENYLTYRWLDRGSDERQYCAPGVDLPVVTMMRSKYGQYPEYHTSLDNLTDVVTPQGLQGGYEALRRALEALERNCYPQMTVLGEPQLGKRGLYPTISSKGSAAHLSLLNDVISYADGATSLLEIAEHCGAPIWQVYPIIDTLVEHKLIVCHQALRKTA